MIPLLMMTMGANVALSAEPTSVWVDFSHPRAAETVQRLGMGWSEGWNGDWIRMDGDPDMVQSLKEQGIPLYPAIKAALPPSDAAGYHTPDEMLEKMEELHTTYPDLTQRVDLGQSVQGRVIAGLRISATSNPGHQWRILGAHHGDEGSSAELAIETATALLKGYGTETDITQLLDNQAVWVVPHVNPDGVALDSRYSANEVDLNRNYSYFWSESAYRSGDYPFSEPETQAIRALSAWTPFGAGLSMHSGALNIGWVWNYTTVPTPDANLLEQMADTYADNCVLDGFWTTNGADWYTTYGDTNDWSYGQYGVLDFTLEASETKSPDLETLNTMLEGHISAVLAFVMEPDLFTGQVIDAESGFGIPATLSLPDDGWFLTTGPSGFFGRPSNSDSLELYVEAPGYVSQSVTINVTESQTISMARSNLATTLPSPRIISQTSNGTFSLDADANWVQLTRPGEDTITAQYIDGAWSIGLTPLHPGPWSVVTDHGVSPRVLFVGEVDNSVSVIDAIYASNTLTMTGEGFGTGSHAWAFTGLAREPIPLEIESETASEIVLVINDKLDTTQPVDVVLVTNGRQLVAIDALDRVLIDTAAPIDTGNPQQNADTASINTGNTQTGLATGPGCGCRQVTLAATFLPALLSMTFPLVRRET